MVIVNKLQLKIILTSLAATLLLSACSQNGMYGDMRAKNLTTYGKHINDVRLKLPAKVGWTYDSNFTSLGLEKMYYPEVQDAVNWKQAIYIQRYPDSSAVLFANKQIDAARLVCSSFRVTGRANDVAHNTVFYVASDGPNCKQAGARNKTFVVKILPGQRKGVVKVQYVYIEGKVSKADVARGFASIKLAHI